MNKAWCLKIIAALLITGFILYKVGPEKIAQTFLTANPFYLTLSYVIAVTSLVTHSLNLKILLYPIKKISWRKSFKYYSYGWALGSITPARLGEYYVAHFLKEEDVKRTDSIAVITLDKIMTVIALLILSFYNIAVVLLVVIFLAHFLAKNLGISTPPTLGKALKTMLNYMKNHKLLLINNLFFSVSKTMLNYMKNHKLLLINNLFFSLLKWCLFGISYYIIFLSLGEAINPLVLISSLSLSVLFGLLPITFSGIGIREGVFISLMSLYNVDPTIAATGSIIALVVYYSLSIPVFIYFIKTANIKLQLLK